MKKIVVTGANPAWQKTLIFPAFNKGSVNRARSVTSFASGKGINFVRALQVNGKAEGLLIQFSGGENGRRIAAELLEEGLHARHVHIDGETRICTTCLDENDNSMTELIDPSPTVRPDEVDEFRHLVEEALPDMDALALCGTLPAGADFQLYLDCARSANRLGKIILLDSYQKVEPILQNSDGNVILKINVDELLMLTCENTAVDGLKRLDRDYQLRFAAITDGPKQAYLLLDHRIYIYTLPSVGRIVNPIGSGDTASAVLLAETLAKSDPLNAFKLALASATANCMTIKCASFDPAFAREFAQKITITELS